MDNHQKDNLEKLFATPDHLRPRIEPRYSDCEYPHFYDLNAFIKSHCSSDAITVLDYGAGASPYKKYFPKADYRTADLLEIPNLTYSIGLDSKIAEKNEVFDLVLSTQVLEHVSDVSSYLSESYRLLKKDGILLLTTHGVWEEHGVPYDFNRWNEEGMRRDLTKAGFTQITIYKLTCGLRAALFLFIKELFAAKCPPSQPAKLCFKLFRFIISRTFGFSYRISNKYWPDQRIVQVEHGKPNPSFYIVIAAIARK